jgi:large subunit ribosomal protein L23
MSASLLLKKQKHQSTGSERAVEAMSHYPPRQKDSVSPMIEQANPSGAPADASFGNKEALSSSSADFSVFGKPARNPLIRPHITEKTGRLAQDRAYVFIVSRDATKPAIKAAVEERYRVNVERVRVASIPASFKQRGGRVTRKRRALKKAIVTLKPGQKIEEISA